MRRFLDNLLTEFRRWDTDKWVHIVVFTVLSWVVAVVTWGILMITGFSLHAERPVVGLVGVTAGIITAFWKEWYDKRTEDLFDKEDLAASFIGVAIFYVIYSI